MTEKKSVYNQKRNEYAQKYIHDNYKQLSIRLLKEGDITRETIAEAAQQAGMSVNAYVVTAIKEKMVRDGFLVEPDPRSDPE